MNDYDDSNETSKYNYYYEYIDHEQNHDDGEEHFFDELMNQDQHSINRFLNI